MTVLVANDETQKALVMSMSRDGCMQRDSVFPSEGLLHPSFLEQSPDGRTGALEE